MPKAGFNCHINWYKRVNLMRHWFVSFNQLYLKDISFQVFKLTNRLYHCPILPRARALLESSVLHIPISGYQALKLTQKILVDRDYSQMHLPWINRFGHYYNSFGVNRVRSFLFCTELSSLSCLWTMWKFENFHSLLINHASK